jgi:predicted Zn finger-like uncharacterized protein
VHKFPAVKFSIMHRREIDFAKIRASLNTVCPHCNASIPPEDQSRVDWEHLKCPRCGETFVPKS